MQQSVIHIKSSCNREYHLSINIAAPVEKVFHAWTQAELVKQWWGPYGFTNPVCVVDARTGGRLHIEMTAPDGAVFPMNGIFHQVTPFSKLAFTTTAFEDQDGNEQLEYLHTVHFEKGPFETTRLSMTAEIRRCVPEINCVMDGIREGWYQSLEKLDQLMRNENF